MNLSFENPKLDSISVEKKPSSFSGKDFRFDQLEHYDFERLMYCLYRNEIQHEYISYEKIQLMSGVRDNGRDCVLYNDEKISGIIQCKHSSKSKSLAIGICAKEIIRYALYSIQNRDLLPDISSFVYFFAASAGFDSDCSTFLKTFNTSIARQEGLNGWVAQVISSSQQLKDVNKDEIIIELLAILQSIKIELVIPTDIDLLLRKAYNSEVAKKFFEVAMVVDSVLMEETRQTLEK